jgi:hypothetical protein
LDDYGIIQDVARNGDLSLMHFSGDPSNPSQPNPTVFKNTLVILPLSPIIIFSILTLKRVIMNLAILTTDTDEIQLSGFQDLNLNFPEYHTQEGCKPPEDTTAETDSDNESIPDPLDM